MIEVKGGKAFDKSAFGMKDGAYYTLEEYCTIYNLTEETVRKWKQRGHIRAFSLFGRTYIPADQPPHEGKIGRPKRKKT